MICITGILLKFADDTKLMGKVGRFEKIEKLRGDMKKLGAWSKMVFIADKCKVLHSGHNNVVNGLPACPLMLVWSPAGRVT